MDDKLNDRAALLSALEEARAGNAALLAHHQAEDARLSAERDEAESRADALQTEVERLTRERESDKEAFLADIGARAATYDAIEEGLLGAIDRLRARADAAWRAALEAAAKEAERIHLSNPKGAGRGVLLVLADTIRALPPPSATPAAPCAHPADRRVGPPGLGFSVCGVCLANIPAPPPSATAAPDEEEKCQELCHACRVALTPTAIHAEWCPGRAPSRGEVG